MQMEMDNSTGCLGNINTTSWLNEYEYDDTDHQWDHGNQFLLPWWRTLLWTILFVVMIVVSTVGNLIVIWIVLTNQQMRTVTNFFLVNLSVADTILATFTVVFNFSYMMFNDWPYGRIYCNISQSIAIIAICASVFTITAISVERYMAVIHPLKPRLRKKMSICIVLAIWFASLIIGIPNMLFSTTFELEEENGTRILCYLRWPDGAISLHGYQDYVYNVLLTALTYVLPICVMSYAYLVVGMKLWRSQGIGESADRQLEKIKAKRMVVKMLMMIVTIFAICWLPQNLYFIICFHFQEINNWAYIQEIYLGVYWLAMSNSMYNPIIICWMNARFRNGFLQVSYWWFRCLRPTTSSKINNHSVINHIALTQIERFISPPRSLRTYLTRKKSLKVMEGITNSTDVGNSWLNEYDETDQWDVDTNQFMLPGWRTLLWTLLFVVVVVISAGGNLIVIWIVLSNKQMRTVTNYFLINLSVADTILATFTVVFNYSYMVYNDWPYGRMYCTISQFIAITSICASVFTLMAISFERYTAIIYPLRTRLRKATTIFIVLAIWFVSLLIAIPNMLYSTTFELKEKEGTRILCYLRWPDGAISLHGYQDYVYNVLLTTLTYFLPIFAMIYSYLVVGIKLWGSQGIGESVERQIGNIKSKRKVVKMLIVVVTIFVICWLPQNLYFIICFHYYMYNPIIYCWMNDRFRNGFLQVFYWWFRCFRRVTTSGQIQSSSALSSQTAGRVQSARIPTLIPPGKS